MLSLAPEMYVVPDETAFTFGCFLLQVISTFSNSGLALLMKNIHSWYSVWASSILYEINLFEYLYVPWLNVSTWKATSIWLTVRRKTFCLCQQNFQWTFFFAKKVNILRTGKTMGIEWTKQQPKRKKKGNSIEISLSDCKHVSTVIPLAYQLISIHFSLSFIVLSFSTCNMQNHVLVHCTNTI